MAEAVNKATELSSEYYSHKRSSLLASAIFLTLCLPGIDLEDFNFAGIKFQPHIEWLVPFLAGAIAFYYLLHYGLIWMTESDRHARSLKSETSAIYQVLTDAAKRCADAVDELRARIEAVKDYSNAAHEPLTDEQAWDVIDCEIGEIVPYNVNNYLGTQVAKSILADFLWAADGTGERRLRENLCLPTTPNHPGVEEHLVKPMAQIIDAQFREQSADLLRHALLNLRSKRPDLFILIGPAAYATRELQISIPIQIEKLGRTRKTLGAAARTISFNKPLLNLRIVALDLVVPLVLFVFAAGLYLARYVFGIKIGL